MPVLPQVGSTMIESGRSRPSRSAPSIIARATRSLMLPPGLRNSALAKMFSPLSRTSGVLPIRSRMLSVSTAAPHGNKRDQTPAKLHILAKAAEYGKVPHSPTMLYPQST